MNLYVTISPKLLTTEECELVLETANNLQPAKIFRRGVEILDETVRRSSVQSIGIEKLPDVVEKLRACMLRANNNNWKFDIDGLEQELIVAKYGVGDFYDWHVDAHNDATDHLKLRIQVLLSPPTAYTGGKREFAPYCPCGRDITQGSAIVTPAFRTTKITPIESGELWTLTAWLKGPHLR